MKRWRVGLVGSRFGAVVHLPAYRAQGSFEIVAIASPTNAHRVARERDIPRAFRSLRELLDEVDVDVVSIASPPFDHRAAVLLALERGKHVLCEKPFALTVAQAEEMVAAESSAGTVCALAHEFRYTPSRLAMRELIRNGHLGPLREIEYTTLSGTLRATFERPDSWWFRRECGGGVAGASLSHLIDTANWLAGRAPQRATGLLRTANAERSFEGKRFRTDVDDGAFAVIDYGDGLIGRVAADGTSAVDSAVLAAHGETRTAVASGPTILESTTFVVDADETSEL
ncbi:MAG: Gfo/Idh/MocA family oxidoreductase, partial [Candidatus Eremiobacteraeota bacterium]|nr:Gfo/Idh/MocA family oxidoreductase [Candidatus Eremiobacteraeota bacterium]